MSDWIPHALQLLAIGVGIVVVSWQLKRQHDSALRLQEEHLKDEIRTKLYERLADAVENASFALTGAIGAARRARAIAESGDRTAILAARDASPSMFKALEEVSQSITRMIVVIERYEIVFPGFAAIRLALVEEFKEFLLAHSRFSNVVSRYLSFQGQPHEQASIDQVFPLKASQDDLNELRELYEAYAAVGYNLEGYTADVRIEGQNALLGHLFGRQLPRRKPGDPTIKVLRATSE
jgi:hypothetical protein